jgi:hypothetical protein
MAIYPVDTHDESNTTPDIFHRSLTHQPYRSHIIYFVDPLKSIAIRDILKSNGSAPT